MNFKAPTGNMQGKLDIFGNILRFFLSRFLQLLQKQRNYRFECLSSKFLGVVKGISEF